MNESPEPQSDGTEVAVDASRESPSDSVAIPELITFGDAHPLGLDEGGRIARRGRARVVVLAGPADSGKTTLLTFIYDQFQIGRFGRFIFRGSKSLPAFERRVFLSRIESGRSVPDTERTRGGHGPQFLHLELLPLESAKPVDLLMSDLAGETFERVRDNLNEWEQLPFIRRADRLLLILDGTQFATDDHRHATHYSARQMARSAVEAGVIAPQKIDILVTKWDKVAASGNESIDAVEAAAEDILSLLGANGDERLFRTAARVEQQGDIKEGHGVSDLLGSLALRERPDLPLEVGRAIPSSERHFHRFKERVK